MNNKNNYTIPEISPELDRGPEWLRKKRSASRADFNDAPLPARGLHLWRYTDPTSFIVESDNQTDQSIGDSLGVIKPAATDGGLVTDLGGKQILFEGIDEIRKQGGIISALSDAVQNHRDLVEPHLYQLVNSQTGKLEALNGALWNDGIFIYLPSGLTLDKPLHLLRHTAPGPSVTYPRLLIVTGTNAELTVIDEYSGGANDLQGDISHCNSAVELFLGANSRVRYVNLQRQEEATHSYLTHRAKLDRDANLLTIMLCFGGLISKQNFGALLDGENAHSDMVGLAFASGRQHFDAHTLQHHRAGHTTSDIDFKVVLRDKAQSAYTGLIRIEKEAQTCEAYQVNRNLLLNRGTRAKTIPELEILNEDVQCSHGATIGPVDPMELFYLQARGINKADAYRMIVSGFAEATLKLVPADLKPRIAEFVQHRLESI